MAATQLIKVNKSILDYFKMVMDFDNESKEYREGMEKELKEKVKEALSKGTGMNGGDRDNIEVEYV